MKLDKIDATGTQTKHVDTSKYVVRDLVLKTLHLSTSQQLL